MAKLPIQKIARDMGIGAFALIGAVLLGPTPIAGAGIDPVNAPAQVTSAQDVNDPDSDLDPAPLIQDPPQVQGPSAPGQKTLTPQHHRSHHRPPNTH